MDRIVEGIRRFRREAPARSEGLRRLATKGRSGVLILAVTLVMILGTNLLIGVATGFGLALAHLLMILARLDVQVLKNGNRYDVHLRGTATFMSLPKLGDALESIPDQSEVHIHLYEVDCLDRATAEHIEDWHERHPGRVFLETDRSQERGNPALIYTQVATPKESAGSAVAGVPRNHRALSAVNREHERPLLYASRKPSNQNGNCD